MLNGDIFAFANRYEAEDFRDTFQEIAERYGTLRVCDVYEICHEPLPPGIGEEAAMSGWKYETISFIKIVKVTDGYLINMPPRDVNIKEDNTMNKINYNACCPTTTKTPVHLYNYEDSPEDVEFEKKRKELMDEAEKKILDIRKELAVALDKLDEERFEQKMQRHEAMQAKAWKRKYDALIAEGFTTEQAWEMTMKSFEMD